MASCVGNRFSLHELAISAQKTYHAVAQLLWAIVQTGLLLPVDHCYSLYVLAQEMELSGGMNVPNVRQWDQQPQQPSTPTGTSVFFRFLHDKCQQAAYMMIPEDQRAAIRIRIGRNMLQHTPEDEVDQVVTDIVGHFNAGYLLMADPQEIQRIIKLNNSAAEKAKLNTAYEAASKYASAALDMLRLLQDNTKVEHWTYDYDLSVAVYMLSCECLHLQSRFAETEMQITEALTHVIPERALERAGFLHIRLFSYVNQGRFEEALSAGVTALTSMGYSLPIQDQVDKVMQSEEGIIELIETCAAQPPMEDPIHLKIMELLIASLSCAFCLGLRLFDAIIVGMLQHSLKHGKSVMLSFAISSSIHAILGYQYMNACYKVGKMGKQLVDEYGAEAKAFRGKVHASFALVAAHWSCPIADCIPGCNQAAQLCLKEGDYEYYVYSVVFLLDIMLYTGQHPLEVVWARRNDMLDAFRRRKLSMAIKYLNMWCICLAKLLNKIEPDQEEYEIYKEPTTQAEILAEMQSLKITTFVFSCCTAELTFAYYSMQFPRAVRAGHTASKLPWKSVGVAIVPQFNFYYSLALLANIDCNSHINKKPAVNTKPISLASVLLQNSAYATCVSPASIEEHKEALATVVELQKSMLLWSQHCAVNFQHKYQLVEAERVRVFIFHHTDIEERGPRYDLVHTALTMYDRAILGAKANQFTHEEALANELAARFLIAVGRSQEATSCIPCFHFSLIFSWFFFFFFVCFHFSLNFHFSFFRLNSYL